MNSNIWHQAVTTLQGFGGEKTTLTLWKTGLPYFDTLRLYGAIELYIGLREDIEIRDEGNQWIITGKKRVKRIATKSKSALQSLRRNKIKKNDETLLVEFESALQKGLFFIDGIYFPVGMPLKNPDSTLKDGVRDQSAKVYKGLESGYGIGSKIKLSNALLAYAGQKRIDTLARIQFLPIFEGRIDYSKVVSPIRVYYTIPNALCTQAMILLLLKTSLFVEGYEDRLSAVVYNTDYDSRKNFNHSGLITISSTALKKGCSAELASHLLNSLDDLIRRSWEQGGKSTDYTQHTINLAFWIMHPNVKSLGAMIVGQEKFRFLNFFLTTNIVKEVFEMSYNEQQRQTIDHIAVQKFARAVASAIYYARQIETSDKGERNKTWYDEVTLLRSAPSARAFKDRALILIEQAKKNNPFVGTEANKENFDPISLLNSIGEERDKFEIFRDLFRMYLILESGPRATEDNFNDDQKGGQQ